MPSEYAIDPTGAGRLLGLTQMGEIKQQLAEEAAAEVTAPVAQVAVAAPPVVQPAPEPVVAEPVVAQTPAVDEVAAEPEVASLQHEMSISLAPGQGAEIKLEMLKGTKVNYFWTANGGQVNYDTHGVLEAAFDGMHGWFWRNRTDKPVTVTLRTEGEYIAIKRVI